MKKKIKKAAKPKPKKKSVKKPKSRTAPKKAIKVSKSKKTKARPAAKTKRETPVGTVTHFYGGIKVAVIKFKKPVKSGTKVRVKGATTDFTQELGSMQYNHKTISSAPKGKQTGVKVAKRVRQGDIVYLIG